MFYIVFDFMMAVIMFLFGMWFYKSEGKATKFLSGYNMKSADERKKYDENAMCKAYGKRMMFMSVPFIIGIIIDIQYQGIGCWIAWGIWLIMFVLLLIDRHKRERFIRMIRKTTASIPRRISYIWLMETKKIIITLLWERTA